MVQPGLQMPNVHTMQSAMAVLQEHRNQAFRDTFKNTKLVKTGDSIKSDASALYGSSTGFAKAVTSAAGGDFPALPSPAAVEAVLKIVGIEEGELADFEMVMAEELAVLAAKTLLGVATTMTPYLGLVFAGKDMVKEWVLAAVRGHKSLSLGRTVSTNILPGDPQAAANAVREMITREATNHARLAAINTAKFTVDVSVTAGAMGADVAGPVTGAAAAGAKLANMLFLLGRDYYEMKAANDLLASPTPPDSGRLFGAYPLLGAYLIAGADDSDLLNFLTKDMGQSGWKEKVVKQKVTTLAPLQKQARKVIRGSRFQLSGFHGAKVNLKTPTPTSKMAHVKSFANRVFM